MTALTEIFTVLFIDNIIVRVSCLFIIGIFIGSFLNVVIYRLPIVINRQWRNSCIDFLADAAVNVPLNKSKLNLLSPPSHCPQCKHSVPVWSNIPLIGYLLLRGKCHYCKKPISWRYPVVELLTGILFAFNGILLNNQGQIFAGLIFLGFMIALIGIDFDELILPDELTLPLIWLGLLFNIKVLFTDLSSAVIGAAIGYLSLWSIYWAFKLITKKEGMGYGDFKLLAAIGAWIGWQSLVGVLLISSILGLIYSLFLRLSGKLSGGQPIPFGPFLGAAGILSLWFNDYFISLIGY